MSTYFWVAMETRCGHEKRTNGVITEFHDISHLAFTLRYI